MRENFMRLTVNKHELSEIIRALDFYSRIWIGQYDHILSELRWYRDCHELDAKLNESKSILIQMRGIVFPELQSHGFYASHGIFNTDVDFRAGAAYDLQQEFRYKLAYFEHPEGGITVNFNPILRAELDPYPPARAKCFRRRGHVMAILTINAEQAEIITNALDIINAMYEAKFEKLFSYYTKEKQVLRLAKRLEKIFAKIPKERDYPTKRDKIVRKFKIKEM